jgi:SAM-dependent methyltransferase
MPDDAVHPSESANRSLWAAVVDEYAVEGWSDPGEVGALILAADLARGRPVLDLGVGGGRTTSLLRLVSSQYVGIDYTPELVDLCRRRHPHVEVRLGDARNLAGIADGSQGLVVFSQNGIDTVDHEGRAHVLAEAYRVLQPGGIFYYSTLNKDGPLFGAHPGTAPETTWMIGSLLPKLSGATAGQDGGGDDSWIRALRNWRRLRGQLRDEGEWGLAPFAAHEFALMAHFITLGGAEDELQRHGFGLEAAWPCEGPEPLTYGESTTALYVHLVARKG